MGMKLRWMPVLALGRRQGGGGAAALQPRGRRGGARLRPLMNLCMRYNRAAGRPGLPVGRGGTDRLPACTAGVPLVLAFQGPNWVWALGLCGEKRWKPAAEGASRLAPPAGRSRPPPRATAGLGVPRPRGSNKGNASSPLQPAGSCVLSSCRGLVARSSCPPCAAPSWTDARQRRCAAALPSRRAAPLAPPLHLPLALWLAHDVWHGSAGMPLAAAEAARGKRATWPPGDTQHSPWPPRCAGAAILGCWMQQKKQNSNLSP